MSRYARVFFEYTVVKNAIKDMITVVRAELGRKWGNSMTEEIVHSDIAILDLLRKCEAMTVTQLASALGVTATAVRQRLNRLRLQGFIGRESAPAGRGRPRHHYRLTAKGLRKAGANFADLAVALWEEIRAVTDRQVREGLLERIARRLAEHY